MLESYQAYYSVSISARFKLSFLYEVFSMLLFFNKILLSIEGLAIDFLWFTKL